MVGVLVSHADSYAQLLTVLVIFIIVLGATALTTKWIAGYQKKLGSTGNIELLDAARLGTNKYIQIIRVGEKYFAVAVCKDTVTVLGEIEKNQLKSTGPVYANRSFGEVLQLMRGKTGSQESNCENNSDSEIPKDKME